MQLAILGILALGGGLLFIYLNLNRKPAAKAEKSRPAGNEDDKGKVIYLFGETRGDEGAEDGKSEDAADEGHAEIDAGSGGLLETAQEEEREKSGVNVDGDGAEPGNGDDR